MVFMGHGFTSGGQELEPVFSATVELVSATLSLYHWCGKIQKVASQKVKGSLYSCLLIARLPSGVEHLIGF